MQNDCLIVLGATGHVGRAVVDALLAERRNVIAIVHDIAKAGPLRENGAEVAEVDVHHSNALRDIFRRGGRAFLLNPPADVAGDTDAEEHRTLRAIAAALDGSGLEKIVLASTYGAQPGDAIGDLSVLYDFEQLALASGISCAINRAAYYYSNFDMLLPAARDGTLPSMFPADAALPMIAPADIGRAAARRLLSDVDDSGLRYVEGPARRSFADAATAFAAALGRDVKVEVIPRDRWEATYRQHGFSDAAARAFARMSAVSVDGGFEMPETYERGTVTLEDYIARLVRG